MTEVAFRSETVRTVLQNAAQRHNILIDGTTSMAETLGEAAALLQDAGAADKVSCGCARQAVWDYSGRMSRGDKVLSTCCCRWTSCGRR